MDVCASHPGISTATHNRHPACCAGRARYMLSDREREILKQAEAIRKRRNAGRVPAAPEPKRNRTHWDYVLEEMKWMSTEFGK